jgi:glucokinase
MTHPPAPPDPTVLAVDVGGTYTRLGVVARDGSVMASHAQPTRRGGLKQFGEQLIAALEDFAHHHDVTAPRAIGIGIRGLIDLARQRYRAGTLFSEPHHYDLAGEVSRHFGRPVRISNDVHAAALAQLRWGDSGTTFTYINIGTGIGSASVDHGHVVVGKRYQAGEISRYVTTNSAPGVLRLESLLSGQALQQHAERLARKLPDHGVGSQEDGTIKLIGLTDLHDAYRAQQPDATSLVETLGLELAYVITNIESILNSQRYVFGGGVLADAGWFIDVVAQQVRRLEEDIKLRPRIAIQLTNLGTDTIGLQGAGALAYQAIEDQSTSTLTPKVDPS